ncbi:beta-ketoacyl synthase N-terminal-like domain-containing protein [Phytomonospora sp. NPDC050363]|uniref:beta-ketoacyl synthase N-terminal-like domain-containing protein n=1 Tax=Phytomonospora sp. NPDC050363 TaxID=3155642 RepID=UPI0033CE59CD
MRLGIDGSASWSVLGSEPGAVAAARESGRSPIAQHDPPRTPPPGVFRAAGFDVRAELGARGTRSMDRATSLAIATTGRLLKAAGPDLDRARTAVILGTTTGSVGSIMDFTASTLSGAKPYLVNPGKFPVTVMNYAAGQCAIWHEITGPNVTVAGGRNAVALGLIYAARMLRSGRAEHVLCGASEEDSPQRAWLEWRARAACVESIPVAEGCVMFHLSRRIDPARPSLLAARTELCELDAPEEGITRCIRSAVRDAGVPPGEVWAVAGNGALDGLEEGENRALREVFGPAGSRRIRAHEAVGDTSAASAGFQLLALLELAAGSPESSGRPIVVTSIDRYGLASALVVRCGS